MNETKGGNLIAGNFQLYQIKIKSDQSREIITVKFDK